MPRPVIDRLARLLAPLAGLVPWPVRRAVLAGLLVTDSRIGRPDQALRRLFTVVDDLDLLVNERATAYGHGVNPKIRLTGYPDFFIARIAPGSRVLDVGCGVGAVARIIAERVAGVSVVGLDNNPAVLARARAGPPRPNLAFVDGDALDAALDGRFDVVVLSNVLEHIDDRPAVLRSLVARHAPEALLIRVPLFERHWHLPLRRELGVSWVSDPTHHIEHTLDQFAAEMAEAKLAVIERITLWGEIWAHCRPTDGEEEALS